MCIDFLNLPQLKFVTCVQLLEIVMQPSIDSFSGALLEDVRSSFMGDVEGMLTILPMKVTVIELANQVAT